jgi:hypothetical protein
MHNDPSPRRGPSTPTEWLILGLFIAIFVGLFLMEIVDEFTPTKLSILFVVFFWIPLLALHEAGHALMAAVLGWRVIQVVIGAAASLGNFRLGSTRVEIRILPVEGFVRCAPKRLRFPNVEDMLIYMAGPGIELLLAAAIFLLVGIEQLFAADDYLMIALRSLAVAATAQAVMNLIPFSVRSGGGYVASDGLGIIMSFIRPRSYYAQMLEWIDNEPIDEDSETLPFERDWNRNK